jgi:hypothetical protein
MEGKIMSTAKLLKQARKLVVTVNEARSCADKAQIELSKCLQEAVLLSQTVTDSMEINRLTDNEKLKNVSWRRAVTLLGTSVKHLWDLAIILGTSHYSHLDTEFRKKEEIILSKITVEWLLALDRQLPRQYYSELRRRHGAELRERFEQEARAATSQDHFWLIQAHYHALPIAIKSFGYWDNESGWHPHDPNKQATTHVPFSYTG